MTFVIHQLLGTYFMLTQFSAGNNVPILWVSNVSFGMYAKLCKVGQPSTSFHRFMDVLVVAGKRSWRQTDDKQARSYVLPCVHESTTSVPTKRFYAPDAILIRAWTIEEMKIRSEGELGKVVQASKTKQIERDTGFPAACMHWDYWVFSIDL